MFQFGTWFLLHHLCSGPMINKGWLLCLIWLLFIYLFFSSYTYKVFKLDGRIIHVQHAGYPICFSFILSIIPIIHPYTMAKLANANMISNLWYIFMRYYISLVLEDIFVYWLLNISIVINHKYKQSDFTEGHAGFFGMRLFLT